MRYELVMRAYDVMGQTYIRMDVAQTSDIPTDLTVPALARTATTRLPDSATATDWTREVLETMLRGL
jgi:hypothetical protein